LNLPRNTHLIRELDEFRRHNYSTIFRLYEESIDVLSRLSAKYKVILVSNCAVGLADALEVLGIANFFENTVLSYEFGVRKPDPRIYVEALRKSKLKPYECVFVSDEISDLEEASEAGLKTILVHQGLHTTCDAKNPNFKPDFECNMISEITQYLLT